jgi:hypothetical protein
MGTYVKEKVTRYPACPREDEFCIRPYRRLRRHRRLRRATRLDASPPLFCLPAADNSRARRLCLSVKLRYASLTLSGYGDNQPRAKPTANAARNPVKLSEKPT